MNRTIKRRKGNRPYHTEDNLLKYGQLVNALVSNRTRGLITAFTVINSPFLPRFPPCKAVCILVVVTVQERAVHANFLSTGTNSICRWEGRMYAGVITEHGERVRSHQGPLFPGCSHSSLSSLCLSHRFRANRAGVRSTIRSVPSETRQAERGSDTAPRSSPDSERPQHTSRYHLCIHTHGVVPQALPEYQGRFLLPA
jgi:hypothetical protein